MHMSLKDATVATRLPARDLERARRFYADKLGLEPVEERPGGLLYRCGGGEFALFESAGAASGGHTQMGWEVEDIEATVGELRARGVKVTTASGATAITVAHSTLGAVIAINRRFPLLADAQRLQRSPEMWVEVLPKPHSGEKVPERMKV